MQSRFIACQHFPGSHTGEEIAKRLKSILQSYGILEKVHFITTDSASNYVAAMKQNGNNFRSFVPNFRFHFDSDEEEDSNSEIEDDDEDDDFMEHINATYLGENQEFESELGHILHIRCAAHKLDKLGSIDAAKANNLSVIYAGLYCFFFVKQICFNKQHPKRMNFVSFIVSSQIRQNSSFHTFLTSVSVLFMIFSFFMCFQKSTQQQWENWKLFGKLNNQGSNMKFL